MTYGRELGSPEPAPNIAPGQFTTKPIFIVTAVVALLCALFFSLPDWLALVIMLVMTLIAIPINVGAVIYGRDGLRAFALGTLPMMLFGWMFAYELSGQVFRMRGGPSSEEKLVFAIGAVMVLASGGLVWLTRWLCVRYYRSKPTSIAAYCQSCGHALPHPVNRL